MRKRAARRPGLRARVLLAGGLLVAAAATPATGAAARITLAAAATPAAGSAAQDARAPGPETRTDAHLGPAELDALTARVADRLRCPVCRNQSVLESSSELARRMQGVIRDRLAAGESPEQVKEYFVARYGDWILLKPEPRGINLVVYLLPAIAVLAGALLVRTRLRARRDPRLGKGGHGASRRDPAGARPTVGEAEDAGEEDGLSERDREWLNDAIQSA